MWRCGHRNVIFTRPSDGHRDLAALPVGGGVEHHAVVDRQDVAAAEREHMAHAGLADGSSDQLTARQLSHSPLSRRRACGTRSAGPEARNDLGGDRLELGALVVRVADRAHEKVVAAGGAESLELLAALLRRADDAVALHERLEVLRVAFAQHAHPGSLRGLPVAPDRDEGQVGGGEAREGPAGPVGRGADLVEALRVSVRLDDVGHPTLALAAGARQRRIRAPADPDRRELLDRLRIHRDRLEVPEPAVEARRRVAPERADDLDAFGHARPTLLVRNAAELELLWVLSSHPDAEYETAAREHVDRRRRL